VAVFSGQTIAPGPRHNALLCWISFPCRQPCLPRRAGRPGIQAGLIAEAKQDLPVVIARRRLQQAGAQIAGAVLARLSPWRIQA
jgi:hypothetical protein